MLAVFRLLFQNSYWRMLLRRGTWREAWLSLRRVHKDRRARKHLLGLSLLALAPLLCMGYVAWLAGSGAWVLVPFVIPVIWWRSRKAKQDAMPLHIAPVSEPVTRRLNEDECKAVRAMFAELALIYAVLTTRAGSEKFLKEKIVPEGVEITTRRMHLELLKSRGLWERITRADRELLMMPDGHWDWAVINRMALLLEELRLLRWILRIDFYLPTVGQQLQLDYQIANELAHDPQKVTKGEALAEEQLLENGLEAGKQYFLRCLAEGIARGFYDAADADSSDWAKDVAAKLSGRQHEDFLLHGQLVSEADEGELRWATELAHRRMRFLSWALEVRTGAAEALLPFEADEKHIEVSEAVSGAVKG